MDDDARGGSRGLLSRPSPLRRRDGRRVSSRVWRTARSCGRRGRARVETRDTSLLDKPTVDVTDTRAAIENGTVDVALDTPRSGHR